MIDPDELSLASIDGMRHLIIGELIVKAIGFAVRAGHSDRTAYRFVVSLVMTNTLEDGARWPEVLKTIMELEEERDN